MQLAMLTCSAIMYHSLRICGTCINVSNGHSSTSKQQRSPPLLEDNGWNVSKRNQVKIVVMRSQIISLHTHSVWETICDALARWSGWKFGSKIPVYPILGLGSQNTPRPPPGKCMYISQNNPPPKENVCTFSRIPPSHCLQGGITCSPRHFG